MNDMIPEESEGLVLDRAIAYLIGKYGEEGLQYRSVLYLNCGTGEWMPRFAMLFSSVTGLEADPEACDEAMGSILDNGLENATALCMDLEEYIREFPNQKFDVVLCCQRFQHMRHEIACGILESLKNVMGPDSMCVFTTTYTEGRRNVYTEELPQDGREGVCLFARPWMERFLQSCGLETKLFYSYDADESALYVCEPVEGTLLRASCGPETASGKVCFMQSYYLDSSASMNTSKLRKLQDEETEDTAAIRDAFETSERYLYNGDPRFPALRHYRNTEIRSEKVRISDSHVIVSFYPGTGTAQVSVNVSLENVPCDDLVYLNRIRNAKEDLFTVGGHPVSLIKLCEDILAECGLRKVSPGASSFLVELNRFGSRTDPLSLSMDDQRCLYGIMTGDEGYLYVPQEQLETCMTDCWTGRDFVKVVAHDSSYVLLNFNQGETYADYVDYQKPFGDRYFDVLDDYFTMDAPTAGIEHGLYYSVEAGQMIRTLSERLIDGEPCVNASHGFLVSDDIKRNRQIRGELIRTLERIRQAGDAETGSLDEFILRGAEVRQKTESVRGMLEQVESDLGLLYKSATNRMVTLLTILGLLFALIQTINSF